MRFNMPTAYIVSNWMEVSRQRVSPKLCVGGNEREQALLIPALSAGTASTHSSPLQSSFHGLNKTGLSWQILRNRLIK